MKRYYKVIFLLLLIFLGINCTPTYATSNDISTTRILFIGNSSTYCNQMPLMVEGLAKANNINCEVKYITAINLLNLPQRAMLITQKLLMLYQKRNGILLFCRSTAKI